MIDPTTILVPIDFSDCAMDVVRHAAKLAEASQARILILHVLQVPEGLAPDTPISPEGTDSPVRVIDHLRAEAELRMPPYLAAAKQRGVAVDVRYEIGNPADVIVSVSQQRDVARIVMGTHGRKGLSKMMLGSVADNVRQRSPRPVEAVPTVYKTHCKAGSCAWCATHRTPALTQLAAERDG